MASLSREPCLPDELVRRHALHVIGRGPVTLLFVHGYGCSQAMWRRMAPPLAKGRRVVLMDLLGFGASDYGAYDLREYETLDAHARDVARVLLALGDQPVVVVGHSVGALIGVIADLAMPQRVAAHVMVSPSPCFQNDGEYEGGFERAALEQLLEAREKDMAAWARDLALLVSGEAVWGRTSAELARSFCLADPRAARQLARSTFLADERGAIAKVATPTLLLQCAHDAIAPRQVGEYMQRHMLRSTLHVLDARGHCPHMTHARACVHATEAFLTSLEL